MSGGNATSTEPPAGPLAGVRVLELANLLAGPFVGKLLCDYGAEVVKVEDTRNADASRAWAPTHQGVSLAFLRVNSNKRSIALDLRRPEGRDLVLALAPHFDVIVEAFRPGRMDQWGLGSEALHAANPRLVILHVSGYGQTGAYRDRPGFGTVAEAMAGFAFVTGWPEMPPTTAPFGLGDQVAGLAGAFAVCAALAQRAETGKGSDIDVALYEPLMQMMGSIIALYSASGEIEQRSGSMGKNTSPRGVYQARDGGWVAIAGSAQSVVERLFTAMERPELITDERYVNNQARVANNESLQRIVIDWVASHDRSELLDILEKFEVAAGPVNDARDLVEDPVLRDRGAVVTVASSTLGDVAVPGLIAQIAGYESPRRGDAPGHGEHTAAVLREELGMSEEEVAALADAGVVRCG